MHTLKGKLIGIAPILFDRFSEEAQDAMEKRKGGGRKTRKDKEEEAKKKTYPDGDGGLGLPGHNLVACLIQGCRMLGLKHGRRALAPYLEATVFPGTDHFSFGKREPDGIDRRRGRNPNRRSQAVMIYRPYLEEGWELPFELVIVDDAIVPEVVRESLDFGGLYAGLGGYRPRFGRFTVEWKEKDG